MANDAFTTTEEVADPTAELVGEGKKFKTVEDLAKGKLESDAFIERLKAEAAQLRAELAKQVDTEKALQDLRDQFKQLQEKPASQSSEVTPRTVSDRDLKSLIAQTITDEEARKTALQNVQAANSAVIKHYGSLEKAQDALKARASELGLSIDDMRNTAAKSPTAFIKLVLPEAEQRDAVSAFTGSVRSESLPVVSGGAPKEGTKEFFDAIMKADRKKYFSPEVQNAIWKAAQAGTYDWRAA